MICMVNIDDFCAKHGCTRKELLDMVDDIVSNIATMNKDEIKHELAVAIADDLVKNYQMEHLKYGKRYENSKL